MKKKIATALIVTLVVAGIIVGGVYVLVVLFKNEIGLTPPKKVTFINLGYTVPKDFREEKSNNTKKYYEYSNQLSDAACNITVKNEQVKDDKSLEGYLNFTELPTKVADFNAGMLTKEKINGKEWLIYHYSDKVEETYYLIYYPGEKDITNNYNIKYTITWDNSEDQVCDKSFESFKKTLSLDKK